MEEKTTKVVKGVKPEKLPYEQLENVARQLSAQTEQLYKQLQEANMTNAFKRLDYLFKVVELSKMFDKEFVTKCANEIVTIITIPEEEEKDTQE